MILKTQQTLFKCEQIMFQDGSIEEWRDMFYLSAGVMFAFSVPFLFFGSGEQQPWNNAVPTKSNQQLKTEESQETKT